MSEFVSADISKIEKFKEESAEVITEFDNIIKKFESINETLLKNWKGEGAAAYQYETDHILENIGGIRDVLSSINEGVIMDIKDVYLQLDSELAEFNLNPQSVEDENGGG